MARASFMKASHDELAESSYLSQNEIFSRHSDRRHHDNSRLGGDFFKSSADEKSWEMTNHEFQDHEWTKEALQLNIRQNVGDSQSTYKLPKPEAWSDKSEHGENRLPTTTSAPLKSKTNTSSTPHGKSHSGVAHRPASTAQPKFSQHFNFPSSQHGVVRHRFHLSKTHLSEEMLRRKEIEDFYKNYDPREGIVTAVVLGGFFVFVSLLVLYKTKCKPMWKNRKKRLTNTPVTHSVVEGDSIGRCVFDFPSGIDEVPVERNEEDFEFECIPLQTVCNDDDDDDDIYFLDEFGNYVFPISSPNGAGSCSCPPSAENLADHSRRVSQVSNVSGTYTVKSLPGGYIYIPVSDSTALTSSVKRTFSDPQIHFKNRLSQAPNCSSESSKQSYTKCLRHRLQSRSFSVQQEGACQTNKSFSTRSSFRGQSTSGAGSSPTTTAAIDINVIQATPNISPSCSLRSFSAESTPSAEAILTAIANEPSLNPVSPTSSALKHGNKVQRRVSFSEDEVASVESTLSVRNIGEPSKLSKPSKSATSQNTLPNAMTYLTVPGQQGPVMMAPALTPEAIAAQTSAQARKRRSTRLMKAGSFCSIASEGDGDIFATSVQQFTTADNETVELIVNKEGQEELVVRSDPSQRERKSSDPLLSEYSEFYENDKSDISELFEKRPHSCLKGQRTLSEDYGSIRSLSIDQEEVVLQRNNNFKIVEDDASSSCSISIESDCERGHQITVPVTIEPPPPEMRNRKRSFEDPRCQMSVEASKCDRYVPESVEEIRRASPGRDRKKKDQAVEALEPPELEPGMRMVLVRDIGVQVSGDSPNLNMTRRLHKRHSHQKHDSLAEKFPAEILF